MSMEGFSAAQIAHAQATGLDKYVRGPLFASHIQKKPALSKFENGAKKMTVPGNENISIGVRFATGAGGTNDSVTGFSHTDTVNFYNPTNGLRANYIWREHHIGMTLSETELKRHGILVGDEFGTPKKRGDRGLEILANVLDEANADFAEQYADTMNTLLWGDGTADTSALAGLRSFILDIPTLGTNGGLSNVTYAPWRNRARTNAFATDGSFDATFGGDRVTSSPANGGALLQVLQEEMRQLRRYGGNPDCWFAGSDFIGALETEVRANGTYSDIGFGKDHDVSVGGLRIPGLGTCMYDPTLDDLGRAKYAYVWDSSDIYLYVMSGDWRRQRTPARPYNQFVFHQSLLCTGQMVARRRNSALVIEIA